MSTPAGAGASAFSSLPPVGQFTIPLFVGTVMNWALLGVLALQIYIYFLAFPKDRAFVKLLVALVGVAEICQTLGDSRDTIRTFGADWGNFAILDEVGWAFFSVPVLGSLIASVGQIFFAWRIHVIGQKAFVVPVVIVVVTAVQLGAGIWTAVLICRAGRFSQFTSLRPPIAWLSATAADDLLIVAGTVFYVLKGRQPGFYSTRAMLTRIIKVTVTTGILCAAFALVDLALFVRYGGNNFHLGVCIWLSKLYSNSILAILNSRARIVHDVEGVSEPTMDLAVSGRTNTELVLRTSGSVWTSESRGHHDGEEGLGESSLPERDKEAVIVL